MKRTGDPSSGEGEEFEELSTSEKILHVQDLWDRIARDPDEVRPTPAQLEEVRRRLRSHEESPKAYETWEQLRARLEYREE